MEEHRVEFFRKEFLLQGVQVLAEPMDFPLKDSKPSQYEVAGFSMIPGLVKIQDVHKKKKSAEVALQRA